jgi:N-acetylglucosamine transport system permease protein
MRHGRYRFIALMLLPPLALYIVLVLSPYVQSFYVSLTDWSGYTAQKKYVGLQNYHKLVKDPIVHKALEHNGVAVVVVPLVTIALALFFATMLNIGGRRGHSGIRGVRGSGFYKIVYFFPQVMSVAIVGVLWSNVYDSTSNGLLNGMLKWVGIGPVNWLGDTSYAFASILAVVVWTSVGFYVVLFSASMGSIPAELFEAATLDGANRWNTFWRLTLPLIWDTLQVGVIYVAIAALDMFAIVNTISAAAGAGGPDNSTQVMAVYLYQNAFGGQGTFGYASALGVTLFLLTIILAAITFRFSRRERLEF